MALERMNQEPVRELIETKLDDAMEDVDRAREWLETLANEVERFEGSLEKALLHLDNLRALIETNMADKDLSTFSGYTGAKKFLQEWA